MVDSPGRGYERGLGIVLGGSEDGKLLNELVVGKGCTS